MTRLAILSVLATLLGLGLAAECAIAHNHVVAFQDRAGQSSSGGANRFGDGESISQELDSIRGQPEFRRLRKSPPQEIVEKPRVETPKWLQRIYDSIRDFFRSIGNWFSGLGIVLRMLAYGLLAAIFAGIVWLIVKTFQKYQARQTLQGRKSQQPEEGEAEMPPGDVHADEYLRRAAELANRGLYREAIAQLILGAMSRVERGNLIRFRRGLTHRDYLRALRDRKASHTAFQQIVAVYEPICFGRREAVPDHYAHSLEGYKMGFSAPFDEANPPRRGSSLSRETVPALS